MSEFINLMVYAFKQGYNNLPLYNEPQKEDISQKAFTPIKQKPIAPHYIIEQLETLETLIDVNNALLYEYDSKINITLDKEKQLLLEKKRNELAYKNARLEEKRIKLLGKYTL